MCLQKKTNQYTDDYFTKINQTKEKTENAERLVIGVGAGLSASGGLNYGDPELAKKWYPEYYALGKKTIGEIMQDFWITPQINPNGITKFWGFWAQHIYHIRYETGVLEPYTNLAKIAKDKEYFICTTNVDGQLEKAGFDTRKIFAPQGDYALFQCEVPCSQDVYDNKESIYQMVNHMQSPFEINPIDVPHCPRCGKFLIPNLRCDDRFVEAPHLKNFGAYQNFLHDSKNKKTVFLELGVGYNTPTIIRFPFEQMTLKNSNATLIRINQDYADVPKEIVEKSIYFQNDTSKILSNIVDI